MPTKRSFASIPSERAISLRSRSRSALDVAVRLHALRLDDRVEDPPLLVVELREHTGPPEGLGRILDRLEPRPCLGEAPVELGPAGDDQARLARRQIAPDLLRDVRHHGVQELEQPLQHRERHSARVPVRFVVEPRLDRLRVPVAEVVEGEVVERIDGVREVELPEIPLHL